MSDTSGSVEKDSEGAGVSSSFGLEQPTGPKPKGRSGLTHRCTSCRHYHGRRVVEVHGDDCVECGMPLEEIST